MRHKYHVFQVFLRWKAMVCKLKKSLYSLKQLHFQWYKKFVTFMLVQEFIRSEYDHYVYFKGLKSGNFIYLLLYLDDMLIASRSKVEIDKVKVQMSSEFEMKDLGGVRKIMGMEIVRDKKHG